ncbi:cytochrome P450 714C2-like [Corylus avellana]|uniref:cytochrome P450 714C2-like n=1 Tax=Corylus avellana TaxID=13451 RepID=UPI001E2015DB|nr:cytochrome P450 714C2-like [Corylus avellana]
MELLLLLAKIIITIALLGLVSKLMKMCEAVILKPKRLRAILRKQGIRGPPPSFLIGNIGDMKKTKSSPSKAQQKEEQAITHNCYSAIFPFFDERRKSYGPIFMFSLGNIQILHMSDPEVVREISICKSLDIGKPSFEGKAVDPLLGQGILTSNGAKWAHQRKILAPELFVEKIKGMMKIMVESSMTVVNLWRIECEGGVADVHIDEYMKTISGDVITRACFGSNYSQGKEIFSKLDALQVLLSKSLIKIGIPALRYLPTKGNREVWRLEKEIRALILKVVKERKEEASGNDLLQTILEAVTDSDFSQDETDQFIVDNCKSIYFAGYETTSGSATWALMLLASNPEWQARVRAEVLQVCGGQMPDADMLRKMKVLTMVIHESLRLYPPAPLVSREALKDLKFGDIHVPKGFNVWTLLVTLHQDPDIWGPDAKEFNPERFANGVTGACKFPHAYMPFGFGSRKCLGQNFATVELKIIIALIVSNFSFSLSPKYRHSPELTLVISPKHGVNLLIKSL